MSETTIAFIVLSASCHHLTRADSGCSRISWFSRVTLPWLRGGTSVAPCRHKCSHVPVFPPSVWPSSRSKFDLGSFTIGFYGKNSYQSLWFWSAVFLAWSASTHSPNCFHAWKRVGIMSCVYNYYISFFSLFHSCRFLTIERPAKV